jgi:hypothetical protein
LVIINNQVVNILLHKINPKARMVRFRYFYLLAIEYQSKVLVQHILDCKQRIYLITPSLQPSSSACARIIHQECNRALPYPIGKSSLTVIISQNDT